MALIKLSAMFADITGKINGTVFQRNVGGLSIRTQPGKRKVSTAKQMLLRGNMSYLQQTWRGLVTSELNVWTQFAVFRSKSLSKSKGKHQSGQALFTHINTIRYLGQQTASFITPAVITAPIFEIPYIPFNIIILENVAGVLTGYMDSTLDEDNTFLILKMSKPLSASQSSWYNKQAFIPFVQTTSDEIACSDEYITQYGRVPSVGEYVNWSLLLCNKTTSTMSGWATGRIQVT